MGLWITMFRPLYCWSSLGDGIDWLCVSLSSTWLMISAFRSSLGLLLIEGFPSLSFRVEIVPSVVCNGTELILCCLIMNFHASGISNPLSLLMSSGWSLMWFASLTLRVPLRVSINILIFDPEPIVPGRPERADHCITCHIHLKSLGRELTLAFFPCMASEWTSWWNLLTVRVHFE